MNNNLIEKTSLDLVSLASRGSLKERRAILDGIEEQMLQEDQVEIPATETLHGGMYAREIFIPKGVMLTGKIHKFDHFDVMLSGDISVSTDTGEIKRLSGYHMMSGSAGKKRIGFAHEDTHWITFHSAPEELGDKALDFLTCNTFDELEAFNVAMDRNDYSIMLTEIGMTEEEVRSQVDNTEDMHLEEMKSLGFVADSKIEGKGYFSHVDIEADCVISASRINGNRTEAGRFTNHSFNPNAMMVVNESGDAILVAKKLILKDEEITVNYREVLAHRVEKGDLCQG